jgi:chromosome segregation ATPase
MGEVEAAEAELHQIENEIGDKESELHHTKKIALKDMQSTANNIQSSVDSWRDEIRANQERLKKLEIGAEDEELAKAMSALDPSSAVYKADAAPAIVKSLT